jgi:RHS repeat-associated protein
VSPAFSYARHATLTYDPLTRLYQVADDSGTVRFGYDGDNIAAEYDGSNTATRRYVHGAGTDEPLVWYQLGDNTPRRFLHADERGSIIAVTNNSGTVLATHNYDENGNPQSGAISGRFGYTGQGWLPQLGMWYYRARVYNPSPNGGGRFMQADPAGYGGGMNLYAYVGGDPVNRADPSGLCSATDVAHMDRSDDCAEEEIVVRARPIIRPNPDDYFLNDQMRGLSDEPRFRAAERRENGASGEEKQSRDRRLICTGRAYVLAGNTNFIGRTGAFSVPITRNSAAIIPRQFTGELTVGPVMRGIGRGAFGSTQGGQWFSTFTDAINEASIAPSAQQAQDIIMARAPGALVIEIVGGRDEGTKSNVLLSLPPGTPRCPDGTTVVR